MIMKKILVVSTLVLLLACNKDKFQTKPQIEIVNYNTKVVGKGQQLVIDLQFTDKEGDLSEGKFVYIHKRTNRRLLPVTLNYPDSVINTVPVFPDHSKGEFSLHLDYTNLQRSPVENDSIYFRFVVVDRAGNKSDTVNSDQIVVLRQ